MCFLNKGVKINKKYGTRQNISVTLGQRKGFFVTKKFII